MCQRRRAMSDRLTYVEKLNELVKHNLLVVNVYRKNLDIEERSFLRRFYQQQAVKRSNFIDELNEEIQFLGGFTSIPTYSTGNLNREPEGRKTLGVGAAIAGLKTCLKIDKECREKYITAISSINEPSSREILIRQKRMIENAITEIKVLKVLTMSAEKTRNIMANRPDRQEI